MAKSREQVRSEFDRAPDVDRWLRDELADFFADAGADARTREATVSAVADNNAYGRDRFEQSQLDPGAVALFSLAVTGPHGKHLAGSFRELPSAVTLLELCAGLCAPDDQVTVSTVHTGGRLVTATASWPFSMHDAVAMTAPRPPSPADPLDRLLAGPADVPADPGADDGVVLEGCDPLERLELGRLLARRVRPALVAAVAAAAFLAGRRSPRR
jgi:hypothetical protein